jgi:phosphoribosylformylglycinamidine synthase
MAFAGEVGVELDLAKVPVRGTPDAGRRLFGETPSRFLLEVLPSQRAAVTALLAGIPHAVIGRTLGERALVVTDGGRPVLRHELSALRAAFQSPLDLDREHEAP